MRPTKALATLVLGLALAGGSVAELPSAHALDHPIIFPEQYTRPGDSTLLLRILGWDFAPYTVVEVWVKNFSSPSDTTTTAYTVHAGPAGKFILDTVRHKCPTKIVWAEDLVDNVFSNSDLTC